MSIYHGFVIALLLGPFLVAAAHAVTLDWDTTAWTARSLSNSYGTDTGAGSRPGNSNVTISFGGAAITSFIFIYGSGSGTVADPIYRHIGIHDIAFMPVPEINPTWTAVGSCLAVFALILRHRGKFRK